MYPLPDGDTGRNMHQTISAALARARESGTSVSDVSAALARGALMGARGNSGVILSQIFRGFSDAFAGKDTAGPADVRRAFLKARENAFAAVERPAGGTMLSLCAAVEEGVPAEDDIAHVLETAVTVGATALQRTMEDNPLNRAAGVVDAGAYGVWLLLAGALGAIDGRAEIPQPVLRRPGAQHVEPGTQEVASWTGGHCVQYLVQSPSRTAEVMRREMIGLGADSVLVVGDDTLVKVHAHAARPEAIVAVGEASGTVEDLVVEDFDAMVAEHERATGIVLRSPPRAVAVVAVVPGEGFAEIARSFYVRPLSGGATMNPSVGELVASIAQANARTVVMLPNDKNVVLAAREAAKLAEGTAVEIIATTNVAAGMAAVAAFDPMRAADDNVARMREAAGDAHGIEITTATRATALDGVAVAAGDLIALLDGKLVARGTDALEVLAAAARKVPDASIVTVYSGAGVDDAESTRAAELLAVTLADAEVEVRRGGQPHYPFIVQLE